VRPAWRSGIVARYLQCTEPVSLRRIIAEFRHSCAAFGPCSTFWAFAQRTIKHVIDLKVLRAMYITAVTPAFLAVPEGLTAEFLDRDALREISADAACEMPPDFLEEALGKGDECYAIRDGAQLAAYGWYSRTPTRATDDLRVRFDSAYVYMYKGLTLDAYRGRRLHAIGMTRALAAYRARGYKGLVTFVEADNLSSLKSTQRMGYMAFGRVFVLRVLGRYVILRTPGCAAFGFTLEPIRQSDASRCEAGVAATA
jgi:hypothetical protein